MPVATRKQETVRKDLKSLEGAFVELRQLSYDEMLERRDGATKMLMERGDTAQGQMAVQIANKWSNHYTFPRCIVDHNLTDENNVTLDFRRPELVFKHLDPRVGQEIERYIDEMNNEEEASPDFTPVQNGSPQEETTQPNENSVES